MIKVSVIVIGYNIEKYIRRCLDSILNQDFKDFEIIYIDDGSIDNTLKIIEDDYSKEKKLKVFSQKNSGPYKARINGLKHAKGEYIVFVDGDDWIDRKELAIVYKAINDNKLNLVFFDSIRDDIVNNKNHKDPLNLPKNRIISKEEIKETIYKKSMGNTNFSSPCNKIIKRSYINSLNIPEDIDLKYGEDLIFLLEVYDKLDATYYIPLELYHYCINSSQSLSQIHNEEAFFKIHTKLYKIRLEYAKKWNVEQYLYCNTAFLGMCELIYDFKKIKKISVIKKYLKDDVFLECIKKVKIKTYIKTIKNKKTILLLFALKLISKI